MDHFSPVAGAHIRVLVLPVGKIDRHRFSLFLQRLQKEASLLSLANVEHHANLDTDKNAFFLSPSLFPQGSLLYRFSSAAPSQQQQNLSPYELYREPLLVLGVADGLAQPNKDDGEAETRQKELEQAAGYIKERHPRVVHRQLIVLEPQDSEEILAAYNAIAISHLDQENHPSLQKAICEVSARFLFEFTTYAKALQASPTIQTPGQTARDLQQRRGSMKESDKRLSSSLSSPSEDGSPSRLPSKAPPLPATSFDQISGTNSISSGLSRSDSKASSSSNLSTPSAKGKGHGRNSSQDRISVQGFGSSNSQEKVRIRGKARVGIVLGSIYMMAGHWIDGLRVLVEHTSTARRLSDHLWHAKGLECLLTCMLLLAWAGVEFQVPSLCDPVAERTGSSTIARAGIDARLAAEGMQRQIVRLSTVIPDLTKLTLSLYRANEGSLELPLIIPAEASVRFSRLLATLIAAAGELRPADLRPLVYNDSNSLKEQGKSEEAAQPPATLGRPKLLSKTSVADILTQALPSAEDGLTAGDHIRLLAGIASSYALLGLERKKAIVIKDLVGRLTQALIQARKLGAAEMGIHPAAALSVESGSETLLSLAEESSGVTDMIADVAGVYGATVVPLLREESPTYTDKTPFGNQGLKRDILKDLTSLCEASPDPHGVLSLTASLLRAAGPNSALDASPDVVDNAFSREEQMHYATVISRTVAVSRHLGLTDVQAVYWDPFLVRGLEIVEPSGPRAIIDRTKISILAKAADQPLGPGNPLLYDPAASRPGTAAKETYLLVQDESSQCLITLQNPFDIPIDIEALELVADGVELASQHSPTTLGPLRFQQVSLQVTPKSVGLTRITGCRVKMQGCCPQIFPIVKTAWCADAPLTVKNLGLSARLEGLGQAKLDLKDLGIEREIIGATVIDAVPLLALENTAALEAGLMLLEGESRSLELILRNVGAIAATVFEATDTNDVLRRDDEHKLKLRGIRHKRSKSFLPTTTVAPGECMTFRFRVEGKAGLSSTQANFYYQANGALDSKHARVVSVPVMMTVNAALQVHHLDIIQQTGHDAKYLLTYFDIRNAWPKSVAYECFEKGARRLEWNRGGSGDVSQDIRDGQLAPGEVRRIYLNVQHAIHGTEYEDDVESVRLRFLDQLHISWRVEEHSGYVDLAGLTLTPELIDVVRGAPIGIAVQVNKQHAGDRPEAEVGSFVSVSVALTNRSKRSGPLSVQLSPRKSESGRDDRRLAVAGTMRRICKPLEVGEEATVEFVLCALLAGRIDMDATVRPAQIGRGADTRNWTGRASVSLDVHTCE
jgi:hypothetical protein